MHFCVLDMTKESAKAQNRPFDLPRRRERGPALVAQRIGCPVPLPFSTKKDYTHNEGCFCRIDVNPCKPIMT